MKKIIGLLLLFFTCRLLTWGDSLVLVNDSNMRLSAVIQDATGAILQETVIDSQDTSTWSLNYEDMGYDAEANYPQTPYTVQWYCMSGEVFAICRDVASDSTVMAQSCMGGQQCGQEQ